MPTFVTDVVVTVEIVAADHAEAFRRLRAVSDRLRRATGAIKTDGRVTHVIADPHGLGLDCLAEM